MCIICIEYEKNKLKPYEALRNLEEIKNDIGQEHYEEVHEEINGDLLQIQLDEYWEIVGFGD
jgi:hypothetical protein